MPEANEKKIALTIAAHPDDPDFGAGATAALWTGEGWEFHYLVLTNGAKGTSDESMTRDQLVAVRQTEQRNAAEAVGVTSCTFLDGEDGELEYTREMLGKIVREIRRLKPYAVFTHTPEIFHRRFFARPGEDERYAGFINHRDHRNAGVMAVDAVYPTARDHLNFPEHIEEGLATHRVREVYVWDGNDPNYDVDVTEVIDRKIEALRRHVSQFGDRGDGFIDQLKSRWRDPDGRFHERFLRVVLPG